MGNSYATNVVNDQVNVLFDVMISTMLDCGTTINAGQNISADGCSNVSYSGITQEQIINVNVSCIQTNVASQDFDTKLQQAIKQMSDAVNQAVDFNPGSTEASNTTNLVTTLATTVKETFVTNCVGNLVAQQSISCKNSSNVSFNAIMQSQAISLARTCTMSSQSVLKAKTDLIQQVSQSATATVKSILSGFLGLIIVVLIIVAAVIFLFTQTTGSLLKSLTNPLFIFSVLLLALIVVIIGFFLKWWPYKRVSKNDSADQQAAYKKRNYTILAVAVGLAVLDAVFLYFLYSSGRRLPLKSRAGKTKTKTQAVAPAPAVGAAA